MYRNLTSSCYNSVACRRATSFLGSSRRMGPLTEKLSQWKKKREDGQKQAPPRQASPVTAMMPSPKDIKELITVGKEVYKEVAPKLQPEYNGVFSLLTINIAVFLVDKVLRASSMALLYLNHASPQWFQFITCTFCHATWQHLSTNIFMIYVFGRIVEDEGGPGGVWLTYLVCGLGGSLLAFLLTPAVKTAGILGMGKSVAVTLGASGAVFGLFVTSVLLKMSWNPRKLLEALILGQFVFQQIWQELRNQVTIGAASNISHAAHLGGAVAGVVLVLLIKRAAAPPEPPRAKTAKVVGETIKKFL